MLANSQAPGERQDICFVLLSRWLEARFNPYEPKWRCFAGGMSCGPRLLDVCRLRQGGYDQSQAMEMEAQLRGDEYLQAWH